MKQTLLYASLGYNPLQSARWSTARVVLAIIRICWKQRPNHDDGNFGIITPIWQTASAPKAGRWHERTSTWGSVSWEILLENHKIPNGITNRVMQIKKALNTIFDKSPERL